MRQVFVILYLIASIGLSPRAGSAQETKLEGLPDGVQTATVSGWIDGDKFNVKLSGESKEKTVLMIGADAPEPGDGSGDAGECYAKES